MKKYLIVTLAMFVLGSFGSVFAQQVTDTAAHDVRVTIPAAVMIRLVPVNDLLPVDVVFDYALAANQAAYFAVLDTVAGEGWLPQTSHNLADVEILAVGSGWRVTVGTTDTFTNTGFGLDDVRVSSSGAAGTFFLNTAGNLALGAATPWTGLGISGDDYELWVDGTESDGVDTITVTYSIFDN